MQTNLDNKNSFGAIRIPYTNLKSKIITNEIMHKFCPSNDDIRGCGAVLSFQDSISPLAESNAIKMLQKEGVSYNHISDEILESDHEAKCNFHNWLA